MLWLPLLLAAGCGTKDAPSSDAIGTSTADPAPKQLVASFTGTINADGELTLDMLEGTENGLSVANTAFKATATDTTFAPHSCSFNLSLKNKNAALVYTNILANFKALGGGASLVNSDVPTTTYPAPWAAVTPRTFGGKKLSSLAPLATSTKTLLQFAVPGSGFSFAIDIWADASPPQAPAFTSLADTAFEESTFGTFNVTASGAPESTFTTPGPLPAGVTLTSAGVLSGSPEAGTAGVYPFVITANNGVSPNATQNFTLTVTGGCSSPLDCPGSDTECQARTCTLGVCGLTYTSSGTPTASQVAGNCRMFVCDGAGGITSLADNADVGGSACTVSGTSGVCAPGITGCSSGTPVCTQTVFPSPEVCEDTLDNDCDGMVDDGCGTFVFADQFGGASAVLNFDALANEYVGDVAVDADGNIYTTGAFRGTVDFDPGTAVQNYTATARDIFVTKLSASGAWVWTRTIGGTSVDDGRGIAVDSDGNVLVTGTFRLTVDFDPGAGVFNLTSTGASHFVLKLNSAGEFVWAVSGGTAGVGIAVDGAGNVYSTGNFLGTRDFDPGAGVANLTSGAGAADIFVQKLDSGGNFVWAASMGGTSQDVGAAIAVDTAGNVFTTGDFSGTADFDPGPGVTNLVSSIQTPFISKLDASGAFVWAKQLGLNGRQGRRGRGIAVDSAGNVLTTGFFAETVDFDPGPGAFNLGTPSSLGAVFISKLDSTGGFVWAKGMGGVVGHDAGYGIAVDADDNVLVTGKFSGTVDFNAGAGVNLTSAGGTDAFVTKLDSAGNFVWAKRVGGTADDAGAGIAIHGGNKVLVSGGFAGTADFNPGTGTFEMTAMGVSDGFVLELTP